MVRWPARRWVLAGLVAGLLGCGEGEVTTLILPVSPDNTDEFGVAQQALLTVGCGIAGCHASIVGNFQVTGDIASRQDEYVLTRPLIDQAAPAESPLLRVALAGDPAAAGHPICFANTDGCAWQIVTAWIADGELLPSAVAAGCTPTQTACFSGGD